MGLSGLEPPTSRLSGVRSNLLSYKPFSFGRFLLTKPIPSRMVFYCFASSRPFSPLSAPFYSENETVHTTPYLSFRKEVIQPHLPIRLPCYDFTPVIRPAFGSCSLSVGSLTSGIADSHGVTGGVYKTRERIHRDMLIRDY